MVKKLIFALVFILGIRLLSLGIYDVYDSTEARYAGIAMRMAVTGDFITPWFLPGIPFLGKPPLAFWATALSFKLFGNFSELAARLPHFLAMILVLLIGFVWVKKLSNLKNALVFSVIFSSFPAFLILAGSIMTDAFLILGISLTNFGFFFALHNASQNSWKNAPSGYFKFQIWRQNKNFGYLFFLGLAISILSKGIVGVVLSGLPCFFYTLIRGKWWQLLRLPLITGTLLMLILTTPWFYFMEKANNGFLEYFIVGENFKRFLVSGWEGDKYGFAHKAPLFLIWGFFFISIFQWGIYFLIQAFKAMRNKITLGKISDEKLFLILSFVLPLLFFSFSGNIIMPYAGVAILPFAIWLTLSFNIKEKLVIWLSVPFAVVMFLIFVFGISILNQTDKQLIQEFETFGAGEQKLYYLEKPNFNAWFYLRDNLVKADLAQIPPGSFFISSEEVKEATKLSCNRERCLYIK